LKGLPDKLENFERIRFRSEKISLLEFIHDVLFKFVNLKNIYLPNSIEPKNPQFLKTREALLDYLKFRYEIGNAHLIEYVDLFRGREHFIPPQISNRSFDFFNLDLEIFNITNRRILNLKELPSLNILKEQYSNKNYDFNNKKSLNYH